MIDEATGKQYEILDVKSEFYTVTVLHNSKPLHTVTFCNTCLLLTFRHKTVHSYRPTFFNINSSECSVCHAVSINRAKDLLVLSDEQMIEAFYNQEIMYSPIRDRNYKFSSPTFSHPILSLKGKT